MSEAVWEMSVPEPDDPAVLQFLEVWKLQKAQYVAYADVGEGYEKDFCHVSAKHAQEKGLGKRVHGWALWKFESGEDVQIWGDFHSVVEKEDGTLIDVTPPKDGGPGTLFVRDPLLVIAAYEGWQFLYNTRLGNGERREAMSGKVTEEDRYPFPSTAKKLVAYCEKLSLPDTSMQ